MNLRRVLPLVVLLLSLGVVVVPSAMAASPHRSPTAKTIHACVNKKTGRLLVLRRGVRCRRTEYRVSWRQPGSRGRTGRRGPAGNRGPAGPAGPAGSNGASGPAGPAGAVGAPGPAGPVGPTGPIGPTGPTGAPGPSGPGAVRISYDAPGQATPVSQQLFSLQGFSVSAGCQTDANGSAFGFNLGSATAATFEDHFTLDSGTDPANQGPTTVGQFTIPLPAGDTFAGGPTAAPTEYFRSTADIVYYTATGTVYVHLVAIANGVTGSCSVHGVAIPA